MINNGNQAAEAIEQFNMNQIMLFNNLSCSNDVGIFVAPKDLPFHTYDGEVLDVIDFLGDLSEEDRSSWLGEWWDKLNKRTLGGRMKIR